jgi:hypothetical protein
VQVEGAVRRPRDLEVDAVAADEVGGREGEEVADDDRERRARERRLEALRPGVGGVGGVAGAELVPRRTRAVPDGDEGGGRDRAGEDELRVTKPADQRA